MGARPPEAYPRWLRLDALLLAVLTIARIRIDTLAEAAVLPLRQDDVARHPFLGRLLSPHAMELLAQQQIVDPIGLLLIVAAIGCLLVYLLLADRKESPRVYRFKMALVWVIILLTVFMPATKMMLLRAQSGPASYSHDGGVIQTEAAIDMFLDGRSPYIENYLGTPMAEWGINEFRTALYHYPYLPWTFLFSAPFRLLLGTLTGWYDQRILYLLLFALTLALLPGVVPDTAPNPARGGLSKLLLVMTVGLNPIMGSDLIYGQNDNFVLAWIALSLWLWRRAEDGAGQGYALASAASFGLACASKPTAWFLAPFYLLLLARGSTGLPAGETVRRAIARGWPLVAVAGIVILPFFVWDPAAMYDDVWGWSSGTSQTGYQIWGWGASNLLLALGWLQSRFDYWPFWLPELIVGLPLMAGLLWRQAHSNTLARATWGYAVFLFAFFFVSRFLNENYLGYILAFLALGVFTAEGE